MFSRRTISLVVVLSLVALGIYKIEQIAKMTSELEDEVNLAIEFFPGRVKRDEWVNQAKELSK
ncbi:MAG TPA: hypothetical protein QGG11_01685 [Candidatus Poseidoniia archaeon]|jgi:predicted flap endonuclease-1-like 5' DNA nuclease|nr:hypothetical protein [Candidatus Poseidoniia archaeon]MDP7445208.1 hypothetical protein [Candidatus Poseidoniia archaeon]MDP7665940.1 hypothetical protein [Candidatus Poseidoniia archaeon]HJL71381.1 hypothetical protein [Candidatus Poseidoniia archaeon]HJN32372.1 hypothetical protein [Candidatus Poseidoniia archaeon]|tara:strand:+ start:535 stop:723 length:189 start_codon:yes stop_codon:yes gene_type:complete